MNFLDLVRARESVRSYAPRRVQRDVVDRCLEAARLAPSACNSQPWSFIVIADDELRRKLARKAFSGIYAMNAFAIDAPVLIVVMARRSTAAASLGGYFRRTKYSLIDIGIACEHLVLQAAEEGLGTCWLGWFNEGAVKKLLKLPRLARIPVIISMGYPDGKGNRDKKRKSLDDIRRYVETGRRGLGESIVRRFRKKGSEPAAKGKSPG